MKQFRTQLKPWAGRLLALVAAAPVLHCGGVSRKDGDGDSAKGGTRNSGGSPSTGAGAAGGTNVGSPGTGAVSHSGGVGGANVGTGGTTGISHGFRCTNPTPLVPGIETGFERCDSFVHRPEIVACQSLLPRPPDGAGGEGGGATGGGGPTGEGGGSGDGDSCSADTDCTQKPHGFCDWSSYDLDEPSRTCRYGCVTDDDCKSGQICECGPFIGLCKQANCTVDSDCAGGFLCTTVDGPECAPGGYACQHAYDECGGGSDCESGQCVLDIEGIRRCGAECAAIGRPFLVENEARLAAPAARADWKSGALELEGVSEAEREALGAAWLQNALMEHASVAAFARFTLELLAVGAPAELVRGSNAAASDETRHAELCFSLASEYLGEPVGPGPLRIEGALEGISLEKLVVTAIAEGCVGETVAAVEAAEQLAHASDPTVRAVLARISEDETRHAELAWRFVKWALERDPSLRGVAEREFERHLSASSSVPEEDELDLTRHGVLSARTRSALRRAVLDGVVRDAARALSTRLPAFAVARSDEAASTA